MIDTTKLRELAQKATKGPWKVGTPPPNGEQTVGTPQGEMLFVATTGCKFNNTEANAQFIATANPTAILELLDEMATLRTVLDDARLDLEAAERDAKRYRWLLRNGLQRAWVSLGADCRGDNFAEFKCEFRVPEPPNLPYEDDEGLQWADDDFNAAIDAAMQEQNK